MILPKSYLLKIRIKTTTIFLKKSLRMKLLTQINKDTRTKSNWRKKLSNKRSRNK